MILKSIKSVKSLKGKKILLRADFNVPLKNGRVADDSRIRAVLPTIKYLVSRGAAIIVLTHLGRPKGEFNPEFSNKPVADRLAKLLNKKVVLVNAVVGDSVKLAVDQLKPKEILMLENVRFHPREELNCHRLARSLASYGDIYVNDAFAVSHRRQSSVQAITEYLPAYAGLLLAAEVENLSAVLEAKIKPKVAVIGGAKLETKIKVIKNLLKKMDYVLLGGAIANNFLKAMDYEVGRSLVDESQLKAAAGLMNDRLKLPIDAVVASKISPSAKARIKAVGQLSAHDIILDIGPDTVKLYSEIVKTAKLVVWNGPLGYFEIPRYKKGSQKILEAINKSKAYKVFGGGETIQLINNSSFVPSPLRLAKQAGRVINHSFISTGGGAMLEFLEGKILPGIQPLIK